MLASSTGCSPANSAARVGGLVRAAPDRARRGVGLTRHARCDLRCVPGDALAAPGDAAPILCAAAPSLMRPLVCRIRVMLPRLPRGGLPVLARGGAAWVTALPGGAGAQWRGRRARAEGREWLGQLAMSSNGGSSRRGTASGQPPAAAATFRGARMHGATAQQHEVNGHAPASGSHAAANCVAHAANGATVAAREAVDPTHEAQAHARSVILGGAAALQRLAASVDPTFDRAVGMIAGCAHALAHARAHTHTHKHAHARTHTHTHTHSH